jgi:hypothetical protein
MQVLNRSSVNSYFIERQKMIEKSSNLLQKYPAQTQVDPRSKSTFCITRPGKEPGDSKRNSVVLSQGKHPTNETIMTFDERLFR